MKIDSYFSPCKKLKFKWNKDLYIKPHTLNPTEEKVRRSLKHISTGENFLNRAPITYVLRSRTDKWDLIKLQSFCKSKDTVNKRKRQPTD